MILSPGQRPDEPVLEYLDELQSALTHEAEDIRLALPSLDAACGLFALYRLYRTETTQARFYMPAHMTWASILVAISAGADHYPAKDWAALNGLPKRFALDVSRAVLARRP